ncbi:MAG: putative O-methyltransferase [Vampirovibrio sp.]|jgi:caffeoyl-CoA O-methyltransferase|nr:putative O-methyltransferase [Vampirovibrio sp.]
MSNRTIQVDDRLYQYILDVSVREPEILHRLREETARLGGIARMQISPEQGQFMALLVELMGANRMLEVGTFTGYSTLACAMALPPDGKIVACDVSREWTDVGQKYWQEAGVAEKIDLRIGPAADTLQQLLNEGQGNAFDAMFIDADKANYDIYYELGLKLVRPGGLIMIDNVLWSGAVANPAEQDPDTQAIRELNRQLHTDNRVTLSLVPIADGLTLARRRI